MQIHRRTLIAGAIAGLTSIALSACGGGGGDDASSAPSLLEIIQSDPQFSILSEAIVAAGSGLADQLGATGDYTFTVFAPTNAAFVSLFGEYGTSKEALLASPALIALLRYHLLDGTFAIDALPQDTPIETVLGGLNTISIDSDRVITDRIDRLSAVLAADRSASNGVVHTVNSVLLFA